MAEIATQSTTEDILIITEAAANQFRKALKPEQGHTGIRIGVSGWRLCRHAVRHETG